MRFRSVSGLESVLSLCYIHTCHSDINNQPILNTADTSPDNRRPPSSTTSASMPQSSRAARHADEKERAKEQENKRNRGAISCAECRRLKLKCDKTVPCSSCSRRGCASICPNGSLTTGQGTRSVTKQFSSEKRSSAFRLPLIVHPVP